MSALTQKKLAHSYFILFRLSCWPSAEQLQRQQSQQNRQRQVARHKSMPQQQQGQRGDQGDGKRPGDSKNGRKSDALKSPRHQPGPGKNKGRGYR